MVNVVAIRLLGRVEVSQGGRRLNPTMSQGCLLAMLLVEPGRMVTTARLVDAVWGDRAPAAARNTIQVYVHRLRRALAGYDGVTLDTAGEGYRLEVNATRVDLHRFRPDRPGVDAPSGRGRDLHRDRRSRARETGRPWARCATCVTDQ